MQDHSKNLRMADPGLTSPAQRAWMTDLGEVSDFAGNRAAGRAHWMAFDSMSDPAATLGEKNHSRSRPSGLARPRVAHVSGEPPKRMDRHGRAGDPLLTIGRRSY